MLQSAPNWSFTEEASRFPGRRGVLSTVARACLPWQQPDRRHEGIAAIVARPGMVDTASGVEPGFLGDEQNAVATGTFRPAQVLCRMITLRRSFTL
jgi:hypothetical protein